jgi:hypothetical protein
MLRHTLVLRDEAAWAGFTIVAIARLTAPERAALAYAALNSLRRDDAATVAAASIAPAGDPMPAFLGGMGDARHWASYASRSEIKANALAAYEAMGQADQAAFYRHISEMELAA